MRYALELAGVEYTDVRVEPGPGMCYMPLLFFLGETRGHWCLFNWCLQSTFFIMRDDAQNHAISIFSRPDVC